jgi:hypothetical protein
VSEQTRTANNYYVELKFAPSMELVTIVRRFVSSFFEVTLKSAELNAKVAVTVHELLENAVKFSRFGDAFIRVQVGDGIVSNDVVIETLNAAESEEIELLEELFEELRTAKTPMDFYLARMERSLDAPRSHLGLARVAVEAEMKLEYGLENDQVRIRASRPLATSGEQRHA